MSALYDTIGSGYNTTRNADPYITQILLQLLTPASAGKYMDIGCGTGNYTIAMYEQGVNICGADPSHKMLSIANSRNPGIIWLPYTAEDINATPESLDGITGVLTIHHWASLTTAFRRLFALLKPGGKIVLFTSSPEQMRSYWLNHYFPHMMELSIQQMPDIMTIENAAQAAELELTDYVPYAVKDTLQDYFLYAGKNKPELYFDESVRHGISSFAALSNREEVIHGLSQLDADIKSGTFPKVKDNYAHDGSDYIFLVLTKKQ